MSRSDSRRYASLAYAAEYLGVSVKTIRRAVATGVITGYRFGTPIIRVDVRKIDSVLRVIPSTAPERRR